MPTSAVALRLRRCKAGFKSGLRLDLRSGIVAAVELRQLSLFLQGGSPLLAAAAHVGQATQEGRTG